VWRQFVSPSPDLNYVWWSPETATTPVYALNFARNVDPRIQAALLTARSARSVAVRDAAYQKVNKLLGQDIPYVWLNRSPWAIVASPTVQNWNNPTTPTGQKGLGFELGVIWTTQIWLS
jgi:ABC-type transport system substrate-binding protein